MAEHCRPQPDDQAAQGQGDQQRRPTGRQVFEQHAHQQGAQAQGQGGVVPLTAMLDQRQQAIDRRGLAWQIQPQQVGQLPQGNHHGSAEGEAQHHRVGDKIHQGAEAQQAQQPLEHSGEKGEQQDQGDVVLGARHGQRTDAGVEHDGNRRRGPADQVPGRTPEAGDQYRNNRSVQAVLRWETGDEGVGNRLRQGQHRAAEADHRVPTEAGAGLAR